MDTILASIRRILNEDEVTPVEAPKPVRGADPGRPSTSSSSQAAPQAAPGPTAVAAAPAPSSQQGASDKDDVLVLGPSMMVEPERTEPLLRRPGGVADPDAEEGRATPRLSMPPGAAPATATPPQAVPPAAADEVDGRDQPPIGRGEQAAIEGLIAARTRSAAAQSFDALHEALKRDQAPVAPTSSPLLRTGGPTLEDIVRDELRRLLSEWLDAYLPNLVEAMVRAEIEKLTRR